MKRSKILLICLLFLVVFLGIFSYVIVNSLSSNRNAIIKELGLENKKQVAYKMEKTLKQGVKIEQVIGEDKDNDQIPDDVDNCPLVYNPSQENFDKEIKSPSTGEAEVTDAEGDACDWDDLYQGPNEEGVDCGGQSPFQCVQCTWCETYHLQPLRVRAKSNQIDIVFVADQSAFTSVFDPKFLESANFLVKRVYFYELEKYANDSVFSKTGEKVNLVLPANYKEKFNFYLYTEKDMADIVHNKYIHNNTSHESLPEEYYRTMKWVEVSHVLAVPRDYGGSATIGMPGFIVTTYWGLSALHELTHLLFDLPSNGEVPNGLNTWNTLEECRLFAQNNDWPDLCHIRPDTGFAMYDCYLDTGFTCLMASAGYYNDNGVDLTRRADSKLIFGPSELKRVQYVLTHWEQFNVEEPF